MNNEARIISPVTEATTSITSKGLGGAILYACQDDALSTCVVVINNRNVFANNYAENDGGAIMWLKEKYSDDGRNIFVNNSAFYGSNFASYPSSIKVEVISNGDYVDSYNSSSSTRLLDDSSLSFMPTFVSGTPFSFNVYIID